MTYRYTKPPSKRQLQIAQNIKQAIATILVRGELNHPFFEKHMISVSEVRISPDLKVATAFMIFPENVEQKMLLKLFDELSPMIRKLITDKVALKFSPTIRFALDETIRKASRIERLIGNL